MVRVRKLAAVVLAGAGILLLSGCGDKNVTPPGKPAAEAAGQAVTPPAQGAGVREAAPAAPPAPAENGIREQGQQKEAPPVKAAPGTGNNAAAQNSATPPPAAEAPRETPLSAAEAQRKYLRSAQGGGVQVEALWLTPAYAAATGSGADQAREDAVVILLSMTTHSGDLLSYDLGQNSVLLAGGRELRPAAAEWTASDSHHPEAILRFDVQPPASGLRLILRDLRGENLEFAW